MSYVVKLHFTSGDKTYSVLRDGFDLGDQVGAKGRHATQSCRLRIRSAEASALFLQETALFVDAALCERSGNTDTVLFEGVVRPYQTVSAKNATEDNFSFEIMDYTEILKIKSFESENFTDKTLGWVVSHIYSLADLDPDLSYPAEMENITLAFPILDADKYGNIADLLSAILFEFGYDYKFTPGTCSIFRTYLSSSSGLSVASIKNQLKVQRDDNWTDGIRVKYGVAGICRKIPIANWMEDISDLQWWRYALPWSYSTSSGHVTRTVPYDLSRWNKKPAELKEEHILYASNLNVPYDPYCTILSLTAQARSIAVEFSWDKTVNYLWGNVTGGQMPNITVYGDIVYALPGDYEEQISGEKPDEFTLVFCQSTDLAKAFAEREYKRAKVAPLTYSFQSLTHYAAGSFVRLTDTVIGIDVPVRILSCSRDANGVYTVKAESADYLGMSVTTQDLRMRDVIELSNSLYLTADKASVVETESVTVKAEGSILDVLDSEGSTGFSLTWQLNGTDKPAWTGMRTVTVPADDLDAGENVFTFKVSYNGDLVNSAEAAISKNTGNGIVSVSDQFYISESYTELSGGEWLDVLIQYTTGYLWRRRKQTYADGTITYSEPACIVSPNDVISSVTTTIEYALSTSPDTVLFEGEYGYDDDGVYGFIDTATGEAASAGFFNSIWDEAVEGWHRGLYVWQRVKMETPDGTVTYSEPVYCKELTESLVSACKFELTPTSGNYIVNKARPGSVSYTAILEFSGYAPIFEASPISAAEVSSPDGPVTGVSVSWVGRVVTVSIPYKCELSQIDITVTGRYNDTATCSMTADDQTEYDVYAGVFASKSEALAWFVQNNGGVMEGYSFVNSSANLAIYTYSESAGDFVLLSAISYSDVSKRRKSQICAKAQKDVLDMVEAGSVTATDFAYFNYLIVGIVTADYIGAKEITLQNGGVIQSSGIDETNVQENGYLDSDGFRLEDAGTLRCKSGYLGDVHIAGQSVLEGQVDNDSLSTFPAAASKTITASFSPSVKTGTAGRQTVYAYGLAKTAIKASAAFGEAAFSGYFTGTVVLDGVTYTGTLLSPIRVYYQIWNDGTPIFSISGTGFSVEYGNINRLGRFVFPDEADYDICSSVKSLQASLTGSLTSVSLSAIVSEGGFYSHDMLPKTPNGDSIGASGQRYKEVWAGAFRGGYIYANEAESHLGDLSVGKVKSRDVVPPGAIVLIDQRVDRQASEYLDHFLPCDGSTLPKEDYIDLFYEIGLSCTPAYSSSTSYSVGACVTYGGETRWGYRCIKACQGITPAEGLYEYWEEGYFKLPTASSVILQTGCYMISTW